MTAATWLRTGALLLAAAVVLGAFGAHGLKTRLDAYSMAVYEKAVWYHMVHALGLLMAVALLGSKLITPEGMQRTGFLFSGGIVLFSGSLYLLALTGITWLGMITPLGGLAFIAGWIALALAAA
jgi:uncharacterized membrane protein YgdD (TMEM256/DUF423 family)